jgi:hypothetical protein
MLKTTNYVLKKPEGTDVVNVQDFNDNADIIDIELKKLNTSLSDMVYQTAGGTATVLTLTIKGTLVNGYPITFIASANNGGAGTTINGKPLYKPGTTTAPTLIKDKAYTVWYNSASSCFFIKASADGNTIASHVLAGDGFSNDTDTGLIGTMPNRSNGHTTGINKTAGVQSGDGVNYGYILPSTGYYDGSTSWARIAEPDLVAANIMSGKNVFGLTGTATNDAVLDPNFLVQGYSGYDDGVLKSGALPNFIGAWKYATSIITGTQRLHMLMPRGAYDANSGTGVYYDSPDFLASNIISGKNIFGLAGTAGGSTIRVSTVTVPATSTIDVGFQILLAWSGTLNNAGYNNSSSNIVALFPGLTWAYSGSTGVVNRDSQTQTDTTAPQFSFNGSTLTNSYAGSVTFYLLGYN